MRLTAAASVLAWHSARDKSLCTPQSATSLVSNQQSAVVSVDNIRYLRPAARRAGRRLRRASAAGSLTPPPDPALHCLCARCGIRPSCHRAALAFASHCSSRCALRSSQPAAGPHLLPAHHATQHWLAISREARPVGKSSPRVPSTEPSCAAAAHFHAQLQYVFGTSKRHRRRLCTSTRTHASSLLTGKRCPHCRCRCCAASSQKQSTPNPAGAFVPPSAQCRDRAGFRCRSIIRTPAHR